MMQLSLYKTIQTSYPEFLYHIFKNFKIPILGAILKIYLLVFIKILLD